MDAAAWIYDSVKAWAGLALDRGLMGTPISQWALALLVLLMALLARHFFCRAVLRHLERRMGEREADPAMGAALGPPIRFIPIVVAVFVISRIVSADAEWRELFAQVNRTLVVLTLFWVLSGAAAPLLTALGRRENGISPSMIAWALRISRIVIVLLAAAIILEIWGIRVGPIVAGFGLFGAAVALGAQDLFKNLIAGIFIIAERRFESGDWILAEGQVEGTVETIGLRTTRVRRFDLAPVFVPNARLADSAVVNFSRMTYRRISWIVSLDYRSSCGQLRRVRDEVQAYILGSAAFVHPPQAPVFVRVDKFNDSSIDLMVYCFTRTTDWGEWLRLKEALACAIKDIVARAGAAFAFPSRSIYVETLPAGVDVRPAGPGSSEAA